MANVYFLVLNNFLKFYSKYCVVFVVDVFSIDYLLLGARVFRIFLVLSKDIYSNILALIIVFKIILI